MMHNWVNTPKWVNALCLATPSLIFNNAYSCNGFLPDGIKPFPWTNVSSYSTGPSPPKYIPMLFDSSYMSVQRNALENIIHKTWNNFSPPQYINSLRLTHAYLHHWSGSSLVQVMACCLFGTKPLSPANDELFSIWHLWTNFSDIGIKIKFSSHEMSLKMSSVKGWQFNLIPNMLIPVPTSNFPPHCWWLCCMMLTGR